MKFTAKRLRLALRSPGHFGWAVRHVLRASPLGRLEQVLLRGYALKPNVLSINITAFCNLRCEMCMQPRGLPGDDATGTLGAGRSPLLADDWIRVIDQAADARPAFYFTGGEPLLYKGLDRILEHLKKRGLIAAFVTNGTLLERWAERLVEIGVDNVTVSIDGPEAVHDSIRGVPGTFQKAVAGMEALLEARRRRNARFPALKINCVVTPASLATLGEVYDLARRIGVEEVNFQHPIFDTTQNVAAHNRVFPEVMRGFEEGGDGPEETAHGRDARATSSGPGGRGRQQTGGQEGEQPRRGGPACPPQNEPNRPDKPAGPPETPPSEGDAWQKRPGEFYEGSLTPDQFDSLQETLRALDQRARQDGPAAPRILFFPEMNPTHWRGYYLDFHYPFERRCQMPWRTMRLLPDGTFEPCLHYAIGNVRDTPLWDLWNAPRMRFFRRALLHNGLYPACARCCYRSYRGGEA
ncbi:MAG TPA: radical SAM/SPASM domain-containing protein [Candidatus Sumerlaeota bacterium]|nr:radical SAM/SPASM domain-containing protein [Candidatus Sumerlaeota bacterium]